MAKNTNLNVSPYFDDFDESKNYNRVLFKPGYPVQAREFTTSQSIGWIDCLWVSLSLDGAFTRY